MKRNLNPKVIATGLFNVADQNDDLNMVRDSLTEKWMVIEGFAFAPSMNKRDYMFELNTIITTIKKVN